MMRVMRHVSLVSEFNGGDSTARTHAVTLKTLASWLFASNTTIPTGYTMTGNTSALAAAHEGGNFSVGERSPCVSSLGLFSDLQKLKTTILWPTGLYVVNV